MSWQDIPGRAAYLWIYDEFLAQARQGAVVVEVGVALGKSVAYLAQQCIDTHRDDVQIYAVDWWDGSARNGEQQAMGDVAGGDFCLYAEMMLRHARRAFQRVRVLRADSCSAARFFHDGSVDLVVLDAGHDFRSVRAEIDVWQTKLTRRGWIGGDDHVPDYPGVQQACEDAFGAGNYETRSGDRGYQWTTWLKRMP